MAWFVFQSLLIILLAFLLGLLVAWLWWGRRWRRVPFGESDAITALTRRHTEDLSERDTEVERLRGALAERSTTVTGSPSSRRRRGGITREPDVIELPTDDTVDVRTSRTGSSAAIARQPDPAGGPDGPTCATGGVPLPGEDGTDAPAAPRTGGPDRLERVEGIGPRIARALNEAGIHTYDQLAATGDDTLRAALSSSGLSFAPSLTSWSDQARLLAVGDEEGFAALVRDLDRTPVAPASPERQTTGFGGDEGTAVAPPVLKDRATATGPLPLLVPREGTDGDGDAAAGTGDLGADVPAPAADLQAPAVDTAAVGTAGTGTAAPDRLERIEGVGPRIAGALREAGLDSFAAVADADRATLQAALERARLRFAPSLATWSEQARLLAEGDEAGFAALLQRIADGRSR